MFGDLVEGHPVPVGPVVVAAGGARGLLLGVEVLEDLSREARDGVLLAVLLPPYRVALAELAGDGGMVDRIPLLVPQVRGQPLLEVNLVTLLKEAVIDEGRYGRRVPLLRLLPLLLLLLYTGDVLLGLLKRDDPLRHQHDLLVEAIWRDPHAGDVETELPEPQDGGGDLLGEALRTQDDTRLVGQLLKVVEVDEPDQPGPEVLVGDVPGRLLKVIGSKAEGASRSSWRPWRCT